MNTKTVKFKNREFVINESDYEHYINIRLNKYCDATIEGCLAIMQHNQVISNKFEKHIHQEEST